MFRRLFSEHSVCWVSAVLLFCLTFWLFYLHAVAPPWGTFQGDLRSHLNVARQIAQQQQTLPHPGFHYTILSLSGMTGMSLELTSALVLASATTASYVIVYTMLTFYTKEVYSRSSLAALALVLAVVSAIYMPFFSKNIYLGQGTPNPWHNPTWAMMQPFALLTFFWSERSLRRSEWRQALRLAILGSGSLVLATFCKPNFAPVLLPALGVYSLIRRPHASPWAMSVALMSVIVAPALVLLGWQYVITYGSANSDSVSVVFAPFEVWGAYSPNVAVSTFLTLAFPLVVMLIRPKAFTEDSGFLLAWLVIGVAFLQFALLAESGARKLHGNWGWGYQLSLKIAFVYSVIALLSRRPGESPSRGFFQWLPWGVLLLHLGSGLVYLWRLMSGQGFR